MRLRSTIGRYRLCKAYHVAAFGLSVGEAEPIIAKFDNVHVLPRTIRETRTAKSTWYVDRPTVGRRASHDQRGYVIFYASVWTGGRDYRSSLDVPAVAPSANSYRHHGMGYWVLAGTAFGRGALL